VENEEEWLHRIGRTGWTTWKEIWKKENDEKEKHGKRK
jgi:hypothetical protein